MKTPKPVICTLTPRRLRARSEKWGETLRRAAVDVTPLKDGVSVRLACDDVALGAIRRLVALEGECCEWMLFDLHEDAAGPRLTIRAESEQGVEAIRRFITQD